jgi:hypothetical protein
MKGGTCLSRFLNIPGLLDYQPNKLQSHVNIFNAGKTIAYCLLEDHGLKKT